MYRFFIFRLINKLDPEMVHNVTFVFLKFVFKIPGIARLVRAVYTAADPRLERRLFGLRFPNPVGLAAGLDKNAALFDELAHFGFGFIEVGTVTPLAQPGNEKPRLFRLVDDSALINRMGFNNDGVEAMVERLRNRKNREVIIGGNIGKNKVTPNESASDDYEKCFEALFDYVDYFVVNVSSPNTPGLRELQEREPLTKLLMHLQVLNTQKVMPKPILLKIAPDLTNEQLDDIIAIVKETGVAGVIATNTTISRGNLIADSEKATHIGAGGLSGKPLHKRSTEVVAYVVNKSAGAFPVIAVGGIFSAEDAMEKLAAGATLVQVYTGFVYQGPSLVKRINRHILNNI